MWLVKLTGTQPTDSYNFEPEYHFETEAEAREMEDTLLNYGRDCDVAEVSLIAVRFRDSETTRYLPAVPAGDKDMIGTLGMDRLIPVAVEGYKFEVGHLGWMAVPTDWPKVK